MMYFGKSKEEILANIPPDFRVVDIGGSMKPLPRSNIVVDLIEPFGNYKQTWIQMDFGGSRDYALPFEDDSIDFVWCTHVLEDICNPFKLAREIQRIGRAGYIEMPSREWEQTIGVDSPAFAGFYHHRWYAEIVPENNQYVLEMTHKNPWAYQFGGLESEPTHKFLGFMWVNDFPIREKIIIDKTASIQDVRDFKNITMKKPQIGVFNE